MLPPLRGDRLCPFKHSITFGTFDITSGRASWSTPACSVWHEIQRRFDCGMEFRRASTFRKQIPTVQDDHHHRDLHHHGQHQRLATCLPTTILHVHARPIASQPMTGASALPVRARLMQVDEKLAICLHACLSRCLPLALVPMPPPAKPTCRSASAAACMVACNSRRGCLSAGCGLRASRRHALSALVPLAVSSLLVARLLAACLRRACVPHASRRRCLPPASDSKRSAGCAHLLLLRRPPPSNSARCVCVQFSGRECWNWQRQCMCHAGHTDYFACRQPRWQAK